MAFIFWLAQAAPETGTDTTTVVRIVAGVLALVCIVVILVRRKRKASRED